jgi:hypothetical protein
MSQALELTVERELTAETCYFSLQLLLALRRQLAQAELFSARRRKKLGINRGRGTLLGTGHMSRTSDRLPLVVLVEDAARKASARPTTVSGDVKNGSALLETAADGTATVGDDAKSAPERTAPRSDCPTPAPSVKHGRLSAQHDYLIVQHDYLIVQHDSLIAEHGSLSAQPDHLGAQHGHLSAQHDCLIARHGCLIAQHDQRDG